MMCLKYFRTAWCHQRPERAPAGVDLSSACWILQGTIWGRIKRKKWTAYDSIVRDV